MMTSNVIIDGVKYVPVTSTIQIETIRKVLDAQCGYLSSSAIDEVIEAFKKMGTEKPEKVVSKKRKSYPNSQNLGFKYNVQQSTLFKISKVFSNGSILYKSRKSPAKEWNIQQAMTIRSMMNNDSTKGMTYKDVLVIERKFNGKLSRNIVRKIMYNIEFGDLTALIDEWNVKYNQKKLSPLRPVENNPQKRKESGGLYG